MTWTTKQIPYQCGHLENALKMFLLCFPKRDSSILEEDGSQLIRKLLAEVGRLLSLTSSQMSKFRETKLSAPGSEVLCRLSRAIETSIRPRTHNDQRLIETRRKPHTFLITCIRKNSLHWAFMDFFTSWGEGRPLWWRFQWQWPTRTTKRSQATVERHSKQEQHKIQVPLSQMHISISLAELSEQFQFQTGRCDNVKSTKVSLMHSILTGKVNDDWSVKFTTKS